MANILSGKDVAAALNANLTERAAALKEKGVNPTLAIVRVGEKGSDLSYERGATKRAEALGIQIVNFVLPETCSKEELVAVIKKVNEDPAIHGCLMFRPLPEHLAADQNEICNLLDPSKDVDSMNHLSNAGVYEGRNDLGYAPCTAQACMEILDYYNIDLKGKNVCVVGHSLVVGRPAALLALNRDATTTQCHIFTKNTPEHTQKADVIIVACGKAGLVTEKWLGEGQIVIDVGINVTAEGKIVGDVDKAAAEAKTAAYSPVPGGVGAVTTSVLMKHVVEAAEKTL